MKSFSCLPILICSAMRMHLFGNFYFGFLFDGSFSVSCSLDSICKQTFGLYYSWSRCDILINILVPFVFPGTAFAE
jgi:hypothetical protein